MIRLWKKLSRRTRWIVLAVFCSILLYNGQRWYARDRAMTFLKSHEVLIWTRQENFYSHESNFYVLWAPSFSDLWINRVRLWWTFREGSSIFFDGTITDEMVDAMSLFPETSMLGLGRSTITDEQLLRPSGFRGMHSLSLEDTSVTDAGLVCLANFSEMEDLRLDNTAINIASLSCQISFAYMRCCGFYVRMGLNGCAFCLCMA